jgi:5-methyltetrahydrofolate--homocysteine methyltransferase
LNHDIVDLLNNKILILDGAVGTMLQQAGMKPGQCPELFGVNHPEILADIHYNYLEAGSDIIQTNTFGANRYKLAEYGLENEVAALNAEAVAIARKGSRGRCMVAASIGPTGKILQPMGDADFDTLYQVYKEQVVACEKAGADLLSLETFTDIGEMRAALVAAQSNTSLPIIAHLTFENGARTMMGTDPLTALIILEGFQPLAMGANCSGGAAELLPVIEIMGRYTNSFISVEPNAGMPRLVDGMTVFPDTPEEMAEYALRLYEAGANIIGGCCGTTPEHIRAIARILKGLPPVKRSNRVLRALASRSRHQLVGKPYPLAYIGERINPTARKKLAEEIKKGQMQMVVDEARKQAAAGAGILDVNMGVPGIDEANTMKLAVLGIQAAVDLPLSIDSTSTAAIEEGLKHFVGRPLINSTTGEEKNLEVILPLAKKYGAAVLCLCIDEKGIPKLAADRLKIAKKVYQRALEYGLRNEDIFIDCLVQTASAEQSQVMETIKAMQMVKDKLNLGTVLGISNVSHGLPARSLLNSAFLSMAWAAGLDLPIMNPFDEKMIQVTRAAAVLMNRDTNCREFIEEFKDYNTQGGVSSGTVRHEICLSCNIPGLIGPEKELPKKPEDTTVQEEASSIQKRIQKAVLEGSKDIIEELILKALGEEKIPAEEILNQALVPGIEQAGELYERKQYFLPQLMLAGEAMKTAFHVIKPYLSEKSAKARGKVIMATVEGDIHDIGKNIVCVLLENYGFQVIDLGKDVKAQTILDTAEKEDADIIGLSALMTTTMPNMIPVISGAKERGLSCKIMVGGAVMTEEYAMSIGADAYSRDARDAVVAAQRLVEKGR